MVRDVYTMYVYILNVLRKIQFDTNNIIVLVLFVKIRLTYIQG